MIKINRKMEYALMALELVQHKGREQRTTVKEVCEKTGSPFDATSRVMQLMTQSNILNSEQGVNGGYSPKRSLETMSLLELMEVILGPFEMAKCISDMGECELSVSCNIKNPIKVIQEKTQDFYSQLKISELFNCQQQTGFKSEGKEIRDV